MEPTLLQTRLGAVEYAAFGEGPAVLCLHGALGGYDQSLLLAQVLGAPGHRYCALSRPGYLGTPLASAAGPDAQADLYAAVLDALGLKRAVVMAVSGGGPSALRFGLRHPTRCRGLILASAPVRPIARPPFAFQLMKLMARVPWLLRRLRRRADADPEASARRSITDPALLASVLRSPETWALLQALQRSTLDQLPRRLKGTDADVETAATCTHPLSQLTVPTLGLYGTHDPLVPYQENALLLAEKVKHARLETLTGGEHAAIFTHRAQAQAAVRAFLAELP